MGFLIDFLFILETLKNDKLKTDVYNIESACNHNIWNWMAFFIRTTKCRAFEAVLRGAVDTEPKKSSDLLAHHMGLFLIFCLTLLTVYQTQSVEGSRGRMWFSAWTAIVFKLLTLSQNCVHWFGCDTQSIGTWENPVVFHWAKTCVFPVTCFLKLG